MTTRIRLAAMVLSLGLCLNLLAPTMLPALESAAAAAPATEAEANDPGNQVTEVEKAFAQTMADRDHEAFVSFLSEEAVFLGPTVLRGRQAVADAWQPFFAGDKAPFSWAPESVEVLESGDLAISTGPVFDPEGNQTAIFTSIWRQEEPGVWRIVFDRGNKFCE